MLAALRMADDDILYADLGQPVGIRAGLELLVSVGEILSEAADIGESQAVYSHGGLTPWRIILKGDGHPRPHRVFAAVRVPRPIGGRSAGPASARAEGASA